MLLGALVGVDEERLRALHIRRTRYGAVPGPLEAWIALRGLRTLPLPIERSCANAAELARRLDGHPRVEPVCYPGLPDDPGHARATRLLAGGYGAVLSAEVRGAPAAADAVCRSVRVLTHATSLGGIETTLQRRNRQPGEGAIPPSLLRISIGCEHVEDLWANLEQALAVAAGDR